MKNKRTNSYLALLSVPFLVLGLALTVNPAQARVEGGTTAVNTVLRPTAATGYASNCLTEKGQTVLLGKLEVGETLPITLTVEGTGELNVSGPSEYLTVTTEKNEDIEGTFTVTFQFTTEATYLEQLTENVKIACGDLWATFRLELVPVPRQSVALPFDTQTEPTTAPTEESADEEQPTESTEPETAPTITMAVPAEFSLDRLLPVKLTLTGEPETVTIGDVPGLTRYSTDGGQSWYQLYHGGAIELTPAASQLLLLDFSRTELTEDEVLCLSASADDEAWTEEYEVIACAPVSQSEAVPILWLPSDAERTALNDYLNPTAAPTEPQTIEETPTETTEAAQTEEETPSESSEEAQTVEETPGESTEATTAPTEFVLETLPESGVFENDYFVLPLPAGWDQPTLVLERLELKDGVKTYTAVEDKTIALHPMEDALLVTLGTTPLKAGTYRLTIQYIFEDTCVEQMQMTFFINYSTRSDAQQKEVPDNE